MLTQFTRSMSSCRAWGLLLACIGGAALGGQTPQALNISVTDARPLMVAVDELERKTGWIVTYEDPAWTFADDLQERSPATGKSPNGSRPQFVPRGGTFTFSGVPRGAGAEARVDFVQALLQDYQLSPVGRGRFQVIQTSGILHVVPTQAKNAKGQLESQRSVLDVNVTLRQGTRSAVDATTELAEAVSVATGKRIGVFVVPTGLFIRSSVTIPEQSVQESGRDALLRILGATGRRLSWRLTYLPDAYQGYALSIHEVVDPKS